MRLLCTHLIRVPKDDLSSQSLPELLRTLERKCPNHTLIVATQWVTEDLVAAEYVSVSDAPESEAKTRNQTHNTKLNLLSALTSGDAVAGASCDNCTGATKFDLETPEALPRGAGGSIVSSDTLYVLITIRLLVHLSSVTLNCLTICYVFGSRHDALSLPIYTHFTSPIRRYIDLRIHQLCAFACFCHFLFHQSYFLSDSQLNSCKQLPTQHRTI